MPVFVIKRGNGYPSKEDLKSINEICISNELPDDGSFVKGLQIHQVLCRICRCHDNGFLDNKLLVTYDGS